MNTTFELGNLKVIDLTKPLDPKSESRRCHLIRYNTGGPIPDFHTAMDLTSHLGTHCECPYHHDDNWPSVAELPLTTFMGRAIYVDFKDTLPHRKHISAADLDKATEGWVKEGDILIIDSSYKLDPFTPDTNTDKDQRLLVNGETAQWCVDHKIKCVGFGVMAAALIYPSFNLPSLSIYVFSSNIKIISDWVFIYNKGHKKVTFDYIVHKQVLHRFPAL